MTAVPRDVMEAEADIFLVFTGWDALTTERMTLSELMRWHRIALERYEQGKAGQS